MVGVGAVAPLMCVGGGRGSEVALGGGSQAQSQVQEWCGNEGQLACVRW